MDYNKGLIFLYVCYVVLFFSEERNDVYYDFIIDSRIEYDKRCDYDKPTTSEINYEDDFNLSIYEYEDSSNYFQAITKAIFCLF